MFVRFSDKRQQTTTLLIHIIIPAYQLHLVLLRDNYDI